MNYLKIMGITGMIFLLLSRILLANGPEFIYAQQPVDLAHWLMLIGACLILSFSFLFPKNIFNIIASPLNILGAIAHVGMCTLDFVFWSYGDDYASRDTLIRHLMSTPVIWIPFFVWGPTLLYAGLATQAWYFIRTHPLGAIFTLAGSAVIGLGQMIWNNQGLVIAGLAIMTLGLALLTFRKRA